MDDDLFPDAIERPKPPRPADLRDQAVANDMWDRQDNDRMRSSLPPYKVAGDKLAAFTPTGRPAMTDMFWSLFKADPELAPVDEMRPTFRVNHAVQAEMRQLASFGRMRRFSVGDDVTAAMACTQVEGDLETLFDRYEAEQDHAEQLEEEMDELADAEQNLTDAELELADLLAQLEAQEGAVDDEAVDAASEQVSDAAERLAQLQQSVTDHVDEIEHGLARRAGSLSVTLDEMLTDLADEAEATARTGYAWGLEPGELQRMPAKERFDLARQLNTPRLRMIADIFGALRNLMLSEAQERTVPTPHELYDVEYGRDLSKLLPSELLLLADPRTKLEFFRKFAEGELLQYEMQGKEKLARGGIVMPIDGSGSMDGPRELFAKALMLVLINLAKAQKRTIHVIHFGSAGELLTFSFTKPEDFTMDRIIECAEVFFRGGTNFTSPMTEALSILQAEFAVTGGVHADVVFVTDDECRVPQTQMDTYVDEMHRMQATTWGVACSTRFPEPEGALLQMTEGKVALMQDFLTGDELRPVFRAVA